MARIALLWLITAAVTSVVSAEPSALYKQCAGWGYNGPKQCPPGSYCKTINKWFSHCIPKPTPSPSLTVTRSTVVPTATVTRTTVLPSTSSPSTTKTSISVVPTTAPSTSTSVVPSATPSPAGPNYWFSFGDSYTQTGFDPLSTLPNSENPFGNPPYPGWTSASGPNWVGFVTTAYNKSSLYTYNYAYGGATINATLVEPWMPTVLSLGDQVDQFLAGAAKKPPTTPWTSKNSLFSVWIGINDIGNSWWKEGDRAAFSDVLLDNYFALIEKIYAVGGRNFLFVNVPPIQRSPTMLAQPESAQAGEKVVIDGFNKKLAERVAALEATHAGVKTFTWDSYAAFSKILDDPTAYGFKDGTTWGVAEDIFWSNDYHPGTHAHKYFGEEVGNVVLGDTIW